MAEGQDSAIISASAAKRRGPPPPLARLADAETGVFSGGKKAGNCNNCVSFCSLCCQSAQSSALQQMRLRSSCVSRRSFTTLLFFSAFVPIFSSAPLPLSPSSPTGLLLGVTGSAPVLAASPVADVCSPEAAVVDPEEGEAVKGV